jgi:hypothetical protein
MLTDEQVAQERKLFEAAHPMPENCMWVGRGYAGTEYNAWRAHEYAAWFKGWIERAAIAAQEQP